MNRKTGLGLRFKIAFLILGVFFIAPSVMAKIVAPAVIKPIEKDGVKYSSRFMGEKSGYSVSVIAEDSKSGSVLWETKLYYGDFNLKVETDVQEIRLKSLTLENGELHALTGVKAYKINASSGKLIEPTELFHYPAREY